MKEEFVLSQAKTPISPGPELARGGEGVVYTVTGAQDRLLKIYLAPVSADRASKLSLMTGLGENDLRKVAAWPEEVVLDRQGRTRGFVMRKASGSSEAHELYSPKSRARTFPEADFRFVLHVAANVVRAFGAVHSNGCVIGDVNHAQMLVGQDGRVTLIDCDSFQIEANGKLFTCDVGSPLFTPPELQGRPFRGLHRTADHDRFGMAVLLFQLLFFGRHPYAGVPLDPKQTGDLESAIAANRFAYGRNRRALGVEQPPGTLPLTTIGSGMEGLFERAFARGATSRPDEREWLDQIQKLQSTLKPCPGSATHHYPAHLSNCPWCTLEAKTGTRLFGAKLVSNLAGVAKISELWKTIEAVPAPLRLTEPVFTKLKLPKRTSAEFKKLRDRVLREVIALTTFVVIVAVFCAFHQTGPGALIGAGAGFLLLRRTDHQARGKLAVAAAEAKREFEDTKAAWKKAASGEPFATILSRSKEAKGVLDAIPTERAQRMAALRSVDKQREQYLDSFKIGGKEKISGIGPGRIATLTSFGIETAWDVQSYRIQTIPGFGPSTAAKLTAWRQSKEAQFRFNPNHPIAAAEINAIEADLGARSAREFTVLQRAVPSLRNASTEAARILMETEPLLRDQFLAWKLAERRRRDASLLSL
jgi:DNA-binding helix-hairpin-helix protein with protein kinase domain